MIHEFHELNIYIFYSGKKVEYFIYYSHKTLLQIPVELLPACLLVCYLLYLLYSAIYEYLS